MKLNYEEINWIGLLFSIILLFIGTMIAFTVEGDNGNFIDTFLGFLSGILFIAGTINLFSFFNKNFWNFD